MSHIFLSNTSKDDNENNGSTRTSGSTPTSNDTETGFVPICQPGKIGHIVDEHSTVLLQGTEEEKDNRQARGLVLPQQRVLSKVSDLYDRDGKGYLDPTEEAMRRMDSKNLGFLDNSKVYEIMHSLQIEQLKSQELITSLQKEHQKSMSLKRGIVYMSVFAFLLAISNIGTSFAAARLAKDTTISGDNLVTTDGGVRVATTPKNVVLKVTSIDTQDNSSSRRRFLQEVSDLACAQFSADASGNVVKCDAIGQIDYPDAVKLYQQFCPTYPATMLSTSECNFELSEVLLQCGTRVTRVLGGANFPTAGLPGPEGSLIVFPTPAQQSFQLTPFAQYFQARQVVSEPASQFSLTATSFQTCEENIAFKLYCDPAVTANRCIFIHTYVEGTRACAGEVQLCAQATTQVPTARRSRLGVQQGANNAN